MKDTSPTQEGVLSITPEQAVFLLNIQLPIIRKESAITARVINAVPSGKESYRPGPNSRSALELVWHIASCDIWFLDSFLAGKFEMEDDSMPADFSSSADIAAWYEDEFGPKLDRVAKLPADFWATPIPFFGIYNLPAVMYWHFMMPHTGHHRGQFSSYRRPLGGKVPNF